jgi:hypothetical protein
MIGTGMCLPEKILVAFHIQIRSVCHSFNWNALSEEETFVFHRIKLKNILPSCKSTNDVNRLCSQSMFIWDCECQVHLCRFTVSVGFMLLNEVCSNFNG